MRKIDLNHNTNLKKIEIHAQKDEKVELDGFPRLTKLETLIIDSGYLGKLNLQENKHLKHLSLKSSFYNTEPSPDISHLTELEVLELERFEIPANFNLHNFQLKQKNIWNSNTCKIAPNYERLK